MSKAVIASANASSGDSVNHRYLKVQFGASRLDSIGRRRSWRGFVSGAGVRVPDLRSGSSFESCAGLG